MRGNEICFVFLGILNLQILKYQQKQKQKYQLRLPKGSTLFDRLFSGQRKASPIVRAGSKGNNGVGPIPLESQGEGIPATD